VPPGRRKIFTYVTHITLSPPPLVYLVVKKASRWRGLVMRHTTFTGWIEEADARQMCLEAATRARPNDHRLAVKSYVRAAVISVPLALVAIGATAVASMISHSAAPVDCSGFPAVACHPAQISSMLLSS
jgi:hypothetical protein